MVALSDDNAIVAPFRQASMVQRDQRPSEEGFCRNGRYRQANFKWLLIGESKVRFLVRASSQLADIPANSIHGW
jgi:hypothetical protein